MVDTDRIVELVPHYVAMVLLLFVVLAAVRAVAGDLGFWIELGIVLVVAVAYPTVVRQLGVAPAAWE